MIPISVFLFFVVFFLAWSVYYMFQALDLIHQCRIDVAVMQEQIQQARQIAGEYRV